MHPDLILLPVVAQVLLTIFVFIRLATAKSKAARAGQVDQTRRALHADAWPDHVIQINNNIRNQFEVPVLFYVLCIVLWALGTTHIAVHALAWLFVFSRIIHATIHLGSNFVPRRRLAFLFGVFLVLCLAASAMALMVVRHFV